MRTGIDVADALRDLSQEMLDTGDVRAALIEKLRAIGIEEEALTAVHHWCAVFVTSVKTAVSPDGPGGQWLVVERGEFEASLSSAFVHGMLAQERLRR